MWLPEFLHHVGIHDAYGKDQTFSRDGAARSQPAQTSESHPTFGCCWIDAECSFSSGAYQKRPLEVPVEWKVWLIEVVRMHHLIGSALLARSQTRVNFTSLEICRATPSSPSEVFLPHVLWDWPCTDFQGPSSTHIQERERIGDVHDRVAHGTSLGSRFRTGAPIG